MPTKFIKRDPLPVHKYILGIIDFVRTRVPCPCKAKNLFKYSWLEHSKVDMIDYALQYEQIPTVQIKLKRHCETDLEVITTKI